MAELEMALPMYWNNLARHLIYCRLPVQLELWGRMWAHNMLVFERMHVLLKGMVRSGKNMAVSVGNSYGAYCLSQSKHRFDSGMRWANEAKMSSLSSRPLVLPAEGSVEPLGITSAKDKMLPDHVYAQIITLWGTRLPALKLVIARYLNSCRANNTTREAFLCDMHMWKPKKLHENTAALLKLNRLAKVVHRAKLDNLEFRTTESQEKFKMDNSCIMHRYYDTSVAQRVLPTKMSFGVIKNMYYHQMWADSEHKVVLEVDWYEKLGDSPRNGLP